MQSAMALPLNLSLDTWSTQSALTSNKPVAAMGNFRPFGFRVANRQLGLEGTSQSCSAPRTVRDWSGYDNRLGRGC